MGIPCNCNYGRENIGWILNYIKDFKDSQENDFKIALENYMNKYFDSVFSDISYISESETIVLKIGGGAE